LRIGGNSVWGEYFAGLVDEVRIYSRSLSQTEIQTDMNTPVGGGPGGLQLAGVPAASPQVSQDLTSQALAPTLAEAVARWQGMGVHGEDLPALANVVVHIVDLPGAQLGWSSPGAIWLDRDAAGRGWFIDPTPANDGEFDPNLVDSPARGRVDLLTVVAHELGHVMGLVHSHEDGDLMADALPVGIRRMSSEDQPVEPPSAHSTLTSTALLLVPASADEVAIGLLLAAQQADETEILPIPMPATTTDGVARPAQWPASPLAGSSIDLGTALPEARPRTLPWEDVDLFFADLGRSLLDNGPYGQKIQPSRKSSNQPDLQTSS
jgi:hypothetical protein